MKYKIADYYPKEALEFAAAETYAPTYELQNGVGGKLPTPRCDDGRCPLGAANYWVARHENLPFDEYLQWSGVGTAPEPVDVINFLEVVGRVKYEGEEWETVLLAADAFIEDFDAGKITDLREAFGLAPVEAD